MCQAGNTKIGKKGVAILVEEDIAWFEISMDDAPPVNGVQRRRQAADDLGGFGKVQGAVIQAI